MSATFVPTPEQEQRARWDLLLLDLELRSEQVREIRRYEPAKWDLLLLDIAARSEQVRQLKTYEPWRLAAALASAGAVAGSAVAAAILWGAHLLAAGL